MSWRSDIEVRRKYLREYYRKNLAATPYFNGSRRSTPNSQETPSVNTIAWAAGFFEGEGCIIPDKGSVRIEVTQCNLGPLHILQHFFGGTITTGKVYARNRQVPYRWRACGARARGVLMTLYAFLSPKLQNKSLAALKVVGCELPQETR